MTIVVSDKTFTNEVLGCSGPVVVHFWAPWCGLCRMIDPLISRLRPQIKGQVKFVRVNADESLKLANTYRLKALPTILVFYHGNVLHRFDQFNTGDDLRRVFGDLKIALEQHMLSFSA
ncbi:MAG: thioredoxin domain-containing protein [Cyanobacteria bacterium P01_F01_bin.150]